MSDWALQPIVDGATAALTRAAAEVELEQAVRGIDARAELELHALLADGLADAGFGVFREERYPSEREHRRRSEGRRCDLVLTRNSAPLDRRRRQLELFEPLHGVALDEALWLEVKTVAQFIEGGPNRAWSSELQAPLFRDLRKLAADPGIRHAALLAVLFTADAAIADHDLDAWSRIGASRGVPLGPRAIGRFPIGDRFGNACCTVAAFPVPMVR